MTREERVKEAGNRRVAEPAVPDFTSERERIRYALRAAIYMTSGRDVNGKPLDWSAGMANTAGNQRVLCQLCDTALETELLAEPVAMDPDSAGVLTAAA